MIKILLCVYYLTSRNKPKCVVLLRNTVLPFSTFQHSPSKIFSTMFLILLLLLQAQLTQGVKVIGAGWGRTGTMSLQKALQILGFRTYHMKEIVEENVDDTRAHIESWRKLLDETPLDQGETRQELLSYVLETYDATTDFPACTVYDEMFGMYPDAKVILTTRSAESWYESALATIVPFTSSWQIRVVGMFLAPHISDWIEMGKAIWPKVGLPKHDDLMDPRYREQAIEAFNAWEKRVESTIPADRLLKFSSREGWKPLCDFLNIQDDACPLNTPYPRGNSKDQFFWNFKFPLTVVLISIPLLFTLILLCALRYFCCVKTLSSGKKDA